MKTSSKILHWVPRVLCILAILFVGMFSLDEFDSRLPLGQQILGFIMHNIPVFVLIIILAVAWKWELIGGIVLILFSLAVAPFLYLLNVRNIHSTSIAIGNVFMLLSPFFVSGLLFIISHYRRKKLNMLAKAE